MTRKSPQPAGPVQTAALAPTTARDLADAGRLDAARAECQAQLAASGPSAELYTILGIVHKSGGQDEESKRCFEKALYLQPDHGEALLHLMLLYEQEGAHRQAAALRGRLERTTRGGDA